MMRPGLRAVVLSFFVMASMMPLRPTTGNAELLRDLLPFGRSHRIARLLTTVVNTYTHKIVPPPAGSGSAEPRRDAFFGSGFIVDPSGLIVTNQHVVEDAVDVTVTLSDGTALPARVLGTAGAIDIALLQVTPAGKLPSVSWGNSDDVRVGDQVLAVGNPLGVGESVSSGIVSAKNRDIMDSPFDDYIQTDAAINHGNSGGPLFNLRGEVIGVNTALDTPSDKGGSIGIGFAIPGNDARAAVNELLRYGHLRLGWIGVRAQDLTPNIADALGAPVPYGAIVVGLDPGEPAAKAGLRVGDVILKFGRQAPRDARALARTVAATAIGSVVPVVIWRDGRQATLTATVAEWPREQAASGKAAAKLAPPSHIDAPDLGLKTAAISEQMRTKYKLAPAAAGVVITGVAPGTSADEAGIAAGDVIARVQQVAVTAPEEVQAQLDQARAANRRHVAVLVQSHTDLRWAPLFIGTDQPPMRAATQSPERREVAHGG